MKGNIDPKVMIVLEKFLEKRENEIPVCSNLVERDRITKKFINEAIRDFEISRKKLPLVKRIRAALDGKRSGLTKFIINHPKTKELVRKLGELED